MKVHTGPAQIKEHTKPTLSIIEDSRVKNRRIGKMASRTK